MGDQNLNIRCCLQQQLNGYQGEIHQIRELNAHQKKKTNEILVSLLQDLNEIGQAIGAPLVENLKLGEKVEEEFTAARLLVAKTKAEVKNLVHRCSTLETQQADCNKKVRSSTLSRNVSIAVYQVFGML